MATGSPDRLNPNAVSTSIRPTPIRAVSRLVISAADEDADGPDREGEPDALGGEAARGSRTGSGSRP